MLDSMIKFKDKVIDKLQRLSGDPPLDRFTAEQRLKLLFGIDHFYDDQWSAIESLMQGNRLLLIQRTGFGKSLCYQFPAMQFDGLTVIFSPLIALMRDQVQYLHSLGISAGCVNSEQSTEENDAILKTAQAGDLKILYIAPERQENEQWLETVRNLHLSMIVIDEAHCISVWGHDFRPAFRRIIQLVQMLPKQFPVLATTATATDRVANDIQAQMGKKVSLIRGQLLRDNFSLNVVKVDTQDAKFIWLARYLQQATGSGLVYAGTRVNTELYARWLNFVGVDAIAYHAGLDGDIRTDIEAGLMSNRWKCVVSTNALGMGIDKPDIRFIIHTQMPQSPIHYYQEIGRAGRDGKPTELYLLYHEDDVELPTHFIENARPKPSAYRKVIRALKDMPLSIHGIMREANLRNQEVRVILADLVDQKIVNPMSHGRKREYEYRFNAPKLNLEPFETLRHFKMGELMYMIDYIDHDACRMTYLRRHLGDAASDDCGKCDNDLEKNLWIKVSSQWAARLQEFRGNYFPALPVSRSCGKMIEGVAGGYYGFSDMGSIIHRCKYENGGDFPDSLLKQTIRAFHHQFKHMTFDLVLYIPPTESGDLVRTFALKVAAGLSIPFSDGLRKKWTTSAQKVFQNRVLKRDNVKDVYELEPDLDVSSKHILLIDDIYDSGATLNEAARLLSKNGASLIAPLVIAKTVSGDIIK